MLSMRELMKIVDYTIKYGRWLSLLAACIVCGCVELPKQEQSLWPMDHAEKRGDIAKGNYFLVRGGVANFGEAPKAVQPITPESLETQKPESKSASETSLSKAQTPLRPAESVSGSSKIKNKTTGEYDFTVRDLNTGTPSYLSVPSDSTVYDITAFNHGNAPVSVSIGIDPESASNVSTAETLPLNVVVKPNSDKALVRIGPKLKNEGCYFRTEYSWSIGDYTANHHCPEHYQFPFRANVKAYASVNTTTTTSAYARYSVIFAVPAGTPVLAARKGTVVLVREDKIDILHDDSTIATYGHLGKIHKSIFAGKAVSTEDIIGVVGTAPDKKEGYMQLTVWRPEPLSVASAITASQRVGFDLVSFPLEFCGMNSGKCRVLTRNQMVSRNQLSVSRKQRKAAK